MKHAKEYLISNSTMRIPQLKEYIYEQTGETYTSGSYSAVTRLLELPEYSTISRGVYTYNPDKVIQLTFTVSNKSIGERINQELENTVEKLKRLATVNILEKDEEEIKKDLGEVTKLREIITQIEKLKVQTTCAVA